MRDQLTEKLETRGFQKCATGLHCFAMVRYRQGVSDVITDIGGLQLPTESDWHLCTYAGDWLDEAHGDQPLIAHISEDSPLGLIERVDSCATS